MADKKISALTGATTPLAGTEVLPIVQSSATVKVAVSDLTAGRSVSATNFIPSGSSVPTNGVYLPAANTVGVATNSTNATTVTSAQEFLIGATTADAIGWTFYPTGYVVDRRTGTAASTHMSFQNDNGQVGYIQTSGSLTIFGTTSDYRLKENVLPMVGALEKVLQLKPVTYTWKTNGSDGQGFIAHELQEVVPDCVSGSKDAVETYVDENGNQQTRLAYQGIDTSFLVATLAAAIQELKAINDSLIARIVVLETK